VYPNGETETLLNVPHYDFNWQLGYDVAKPIKLPKGTKLIVTAHYDNSPNNKFNPDPNRTVYHGDMTWEEMMSPFCGVVVEHPVAPDKVFKKKCLPSQTNCATAAGGVRRQAVWPPPAWLFQGAIIGAAFRGFVPANAVRLYARLLRNRFFSIRLNHTLPASFVYL
jgi:hypothetical protein